MKTIEITHKIIDGIEHEWSSGAINTDSGTQPALYNRELGTYTIFTEEEAEQLPSEVKRLLVNKSRRLGAWVMSLDGLATLRRRKKR